MNNYTYAITKKEKRKKYIVGLVNVTNSNKICLAGIKDFLVYIKNRDYAALSNNLELEQYVTQEKQFAGYSENCYILYLTKKTYDIYNSLYHIERNFLIWEHKKNDNEIKNYILELYPQYKIYFEHFTIDQLKNSVIKSDDIKKFIFQNEI